MKLQYFGQSCFLIEFGNRKLLFDPFITDNPKAGDIDISEIKPDYILVSHGHYDHCADVSSIAQQSGAKLVANYEIVTYYQSQGIKEHPMNHGGKWAFDFGTVKMVNAVHSSVFNDGTYAGNPCGFVIWNEETCFYFAGDTALTMDMKIIPETCPSLDLAILPVGDNFTMGYEDAAICARWVDCERIIGCHFDTFGYIEIDHQKAISHFEKSGKSLLLPSIGQTIEI